MDPIEAPRRLWTLIALACRGRATRGGPAFNEVIERNADDGCTRTRKETASQQLSAITPEVSACYTTSSGPSA